MYCNTAGLLHYKTSWWLICNRYMAQLYILFYMDFLKLEGLMGTGDIPYSFVCFEQEYLYYVSQMEQIKDGKFKLHPKSDSHKYFSYMQLAAQKSSKIQSIHPRLHTPFQHALQTSRHIFIRVCLWVLQIFITNVFTDLVTNMNRQLFFTKAMVFLFRKEYN